MPDLRQQADDLLARGDYPAARAAYEALLTSGIDDAQAQRGLGLALLESGDLAGAARAFDRAIARAPEDGELAYQRSRPHLRAREWDLALPHLERAIAKAPEFADAYWSRGTVHAMHDDCARELADREKYATLRPDSAEGRALVAYPQRMLGNLPAALEACQAALRIDPQSAEAHRQLGFTRKAMQQDAAALAAFEEALRLNPGNAAELDPEIARLRTRIGALAPAPVSVPAAPASAAAPAKPAPAPKRTFRDRLREGFASCRNGLGVAALALGALIFILGMGTSVAVGVVKGADVVYGSTYIVWNWTDAERMPPNAQLCKKMFCRDPHTSEKHLSGNPGHQSESFGYFCAKHERSLWLSIFDFSHFGGFLWLLACIVAYFSASAIWGLAFWLLMQPVALAVVWRKKRGGDAAGATKITEGVLATAIALGAAFGAASGILYAWF